MTLRVEHYADDAATWDAFVRAQRGWTHFHLYGWRTVMERAVGHECLYLAARDAAGAIVAVLPLVRVRSRLFGHYLVSMPFVNYGGPLGTDAGIVAVVAEAVELARRGGARLLELRARGELPVTLAASHRKITVVLDLPDTPDVLFKSFDPKLRSQVRKPQKEGVEVRFGVDQVAPFFAVFSRHMRDLGTPTQGRRLFETIAETFPDTWFGCAYLEGRAIACGAGFRWDDEFEMTWASSLLEFKRTAPNMLLYWAFMERAVGEGVRRFNFGRCTPGGGTHRFKLQWGAKDEPLWWYGWSTVPESGTPSPNDARYSWGPRLWRRLPEPVATALGPHIVRLIP